MTDTDIKIEIKAVSAQASKEINKLTRDIEKLNKKIQSGGRASTAQVGQMTRSFRSLTAHVSKLALIYGSFHTLLTSTVIGAKFEESVKRLGVVSGASEKELSMLEDEAKKLGETTVFSASQVAEGMNQMAQAGLTTQQILAGTGDILNLASVAMIDLKEASDLTVVSMNTYGLKASDMNDITDILAKGSTIGATTVTELGQALVKVGSVAHSAGQKLEETVAMLDVLADGGMRAALAGTQLKIGLLRLSSNPEAKKYIQELAKASGDLSLSMFDAEHKLKPVRTQLQEVWHALKNVNEEARKEYMARIFGTEAVASFEILLPKLEKVDENLRKIREAMANDFALKSAKEMVDTLVGSWKNLSSALEGLALKIVAEMTPALREMLDGWTETIRGMDESKIEDFANTLEVLISAVAGFTTAVASTVSAITTFQQNNETLVRVLFEVGLGLKAFSVLGIGQLIQGATKGTASLKLMKQAIKEMSVALFDFAKANPQLLALVAVTLAVTKYIDSIENARRAFHKYTKEAIDDAKTYSGVIDDIVKATDYHTGVIGRNNEERTKLAQTIGKEIEHLREEYKSVDRSNMSNEEYLAVKKTILEQIESLDKILYKLNDSFGKEVEATKKATEAQKENAVVTQKAKENYEKFTKVLDKRVASTEKTLVKMLKAEQKYNINLQKLEVARQKIILKYADLRKQVAEDYNQIEFEARTKNLNNYKKYIAEKNRATELIKKGETALAKGSLDEASRYFSEAKSLATGFAGSVIEVNGAVLANSKETWSSASKILQETKKAELAILKQKEIAELEANANKLELINIELKGQQLLLKIQKEQLEALKNLGKQALDTKAQFDKVDYLEKFNKDIEDTISKNKGRIFEIKADIDKKKFDLETSQLKKKVSKINDSKIEIGVDTKKVEEADKKVYHFEERIDLIDGKEVRVQILVDEDGNIPKAKTNIIELTDLAGNPIKIETDINETKQMLQSVEDAIQSIHNDAEKPAYLKLYSDSGEVEKTSEKVDTLKEKIERLTIGDYVVTVNADTTPADFGISQFVFKWNGEKGKIEQKVNPKWEDAQKILDNFRRGESKKKINAPVKVDTKKAKIDIKQLEPYAKQVKPATQELVTDVLPAKKAIDQFTGWVSTLDAVLKVKADTSQAKTAVDNLIFWINSQVAYVHVYEVYHSAHSGGGMVQKLADGGAFTGSGRVAGYDPTDSDKVSAMLTGGEFVIKREAVDFYGQSLLQSINSMMFNLPKGFADGGSIGKTSKDVNLNFIDHNGATMSTQTDEQTAQQIENFFRKYSQ